MIKRKAFCEFGAYAVNVLDPSNIVIMPLRTAGDLGQPIGNTVTLDFTKILKPQSQLEADFDAALIDALGVEKDGSDKMPAPAYPHTDGVNVLTVGPTFPPGPHVGGICYERSRFYPEVRQVMDPNHDQWPAFGLRPYQVMTTATFDTSTQRVTRYHGFHAKVVADNGSRKDILIETRTVTVDLADRSLCDDPAAIAIDIQDLHKPTPASTALTVASQVGDEGAVFLALPFCAANELRQGKIPAGGGYSVATTGSDSFAKSVFALGLSRSRRIDLGATDVAGIRAELIDHIRRMGDLAENLDLIGDSPGGLQVFGTQQLAAILDDGELARLIRSRFLRCRLLGCYTALSTESRAQMMRLAKVLGIPVLGTTRAISWSDFDKYAFKDFQVINGTRTTILKSTEHMSTAGAFDDHTEAMLASGTYQQSWLRNLEQVPFELAAEPVSSEHAVVVPPALLQSAVATRAHLTIAPEGTVVLQAEGKQVAAEVLASATLLRMRSTADAAVYVNVPPNSALRRDLLSLV